MKWSNIWVSLSRRVLSVVLAAAAVQPVLEIQAQGQTSFHVFGCHADGKICDDFDGMDSKYGTRFTTTRISYCPDESGKISLWCSRREDKGCITSKCMPKSGSKRDEECRVVNMRDEYAEYNHTLNAYQEDCSSTEEKIVCCQPESQETALLAAYGAEAHEFPHQVLLVLNLKNEDRASGFYNSFCGGTIYNEKYILTAAHCVVDSYDHPTYQNEPGAKKLQYSEVNQQKQIEIVVGTNLGMTARASNRYRVERVIVHPQYSRLKKNEDKAIKNYKNPEVTQYDVALLEIKGTIKFNDYTKALKMAPANFRPQDYADKVVIIGWGTTDNLDTTEYLQKANLKIRDEENEGPCHAYPGYLPDQQMCLGGIIDNLEYGKTAGNGDSGGPAICRDEDGFGVHCGITSYGGYDKYCSKMPNTTTCTPSVYTDVSQFRPWIIKEAGVQNRGKTKFHKAPLYGINDGDEMAQAKIFSGDGKICGGTLVSADLVVTASNCIFDENNESKALMVKFGSGEYYVKSVQLILPPRETVRSVVNQEFYDKWISPKWMNAENSSFLPTPIEEPYYDVNIGIIRLSKKVSGANPVTISTLRLIEDEDTVYETAWMRNSTFGLRKFPSSVISKETCQSRYDRISRKYPSFFIGEMDVCMVEKYSGGNDCDRELGGGVFCGGPKGRTLCGVQVFRMCDFSTPKIIADMSHYADTIKEMINNI